MNLRTPAIAALSTLLVVTAASVLPAQTKPAPESIAVAARPPAIDTFHPVVREPAAHTGDYAAEYTVYRPADIRAVRGRLPVVVFGNGACRHTSNNELITTHMLLAARGFLVVAVGAFDQPTKPESDPATPQVILDGITWAERENRRHGSPLRHRIDTRRIAVAGYSCGGIEALVAAADPRVRSVLALNTGFFPDDDHFGYGREELRNLHTPTLFLDGGPDDIAYENSGANYDLVTVPAVRATNPAAGHGGFWYGFSGDRPAPALREEAVTVLVQWLDFTLNGNRAAGDYFLGPDCGLCAVEGWEVATKNF